MTKRYLVAVKDVIDESKTLSNEIFLFESEEHAKGFIADIERKWPKAQWAISVVGDDEMQVRGG